jgi:hypothetical protein
MRQRRDEGGVMGVLDNSGGSDGGWWCWRELNMEVRDAIL